MSDGTTSTSKLEKQLRMLQRKLERSEWHRVDLENQHDRDQHLYRRLQADLEAANREAEIEAALERIRTQSLLMQYSSELVATSAVFHEQLLALGVPTEFSYVWLPDEAAGKHQFWATWTDEEDGEPVHRGRAVTYDLDRTEAYTAACFAAWESDDPVHVERIAPGEVAHFFATWAELLGDAEHLRPERFPGGLFYAEGYMQYGCFGINIRREPTEEERDVLRRFAVEFERAYTRFLDLRRVEAQAREAEIEAALERVRSRTMAMHEPEELQAVVSVVAEELQRLDVIMDAGGVIICTYFPDSKDVVHWLSAPDFSSSKPYLLPYFDHPIFNAAWASREQGDDFFSQAFPVEEKNSFFRHAFEHSDYQYFPEDFKEWILVTEHHALTFAWSTNSALLIPSFTDIFPSEADRVILKRFARVFEQAYTRYLDLEQAEANAREAQIEAALERVRSRALAMTTSEELLDVVYKIHREFSGLGLECGAFWHTRYAPDCYHKALTSIDGQKLAAILELPRDFASNPALAAWERGGAKVGVFPFDADAACRYHHHMVTKGRFFEVDPEAITEEMIRENDGWTFVQARTSHGEIGYSLWGETEPSDEAKEVLVRFTSAFDLAYRRFEDLQQAEQQAALDRVRAEIASTLTRDADVTGATFDPLDAEIRTLFGRSELRLGLATLQADGGLNVRPGRPVWNSLVIRDALRVGTLDWRGTLYETAMQSSEAVAVSAVENDESLDEGLREHLLAVGVRSLALQPLRTADRTVGLLELSSPEADAADASTLLTMTRLESTFALAVTQNLEWFEASVESAIQHAYTAIHPSVRWRFREAAVERLERGDGTAEPEPVVFECVYPLCGVADIRSSTRHRNEAVRHDVLGRLGRARDALTAIHEALPLTILDELGLRVRKRIEQYESVWNTGDEATADQFLTEDVEPVLKRMTSGRPDLVAILEAQQAPEEGGAVLRSDAYETSRRAINRAVSDVLLAEEAETQRVFPHLLELTRTDGVEHTMYIGPSIAPDRLFDLAYVENLRLRQLIAACAIAREVRRLGETMPMPLAIAQLVVVQHAPVTLRFRADEKRFDMDSPSGIRFELLKKRLDKACVKGTEERITQPGQIAVVYSTAAEEAEYRRYADYLAAQERIEPEPERLDVEDLPDAAGLKMLRLKVSSPT
ncbi:hypothetical protein BH23GEM3_BH23GEM3_00170 [soil metagenome]